MIISKIIRTRKIFFTIQKKLSTTSKDFQQLKRRLRLLRKRLERIQIYQILRKMKRKLTFTTRIKLL